MLIYGLAFAMFLGGRSVAAAAENTSAEPSPEQTIEWEMEEPAFFGMGADTGSSDGPVVEESAGSVLKACGSDGLLYHDVAYLSAATVAGFDKAMQESYIALCDEIAEWKAAGEDVRDIVLYVDREGVLGMSYMLPFELYGAEAVEIEESERCQRGITVRGNIRDYGLFSSPEEENLSLMERNAVAEETFEELEAVSFDALSDKDSYFRDQLTGKLEKQIYDSAKSKMVKGKSNSFSISVSGKPSNLVIANAMSAIQDAYPLSFEWADRSGGIKILYSYSGSLKITMDKSKHYSASLLNSAQKKAQTLVDEAYQYAEEAYPNAPAYGLIYYFDKWICENNFYNNIGLGQTKADLASKEFYYCHSSVGILLKGYGVCESYALAMNRLLDLAGVPSMAVYGTGNGGGHAWNYVKMPNGNWYMLDSTWNDGGSKSSGQYLLSAADSKHVATGSRYVVGQKFTYPALAGSKYSAGAEKISINKSELALTKGKKQQLAFSDYYSNFRHTWSGGDSKVAKIDAKGRVTAIAPGKTEVNCAIAGKKMSCVVYVYQWTGLTFANNQKASLTYNLSNKDTKIDSSDMVTFSITAGQKNEQITAAAIQVKAGLTDPKATVSNSKIAAVSSCTLSGDVISLKVQPLAVGSTKINVSFGGKKAALNLKVTQALQDSWFEALTVTSTEYTGKAISPRVKATASLPKGAKYKVTYTNNKNAGTATVSITGTGNYSGTVKRSFKITPRDLTEGVFVSCTASKTYSGKRNPAATVVKYKGKRLKEGVDYTVFYNNVSSSSTPIAAGSYTVRVAGNGNYAGVIGKSFTYTIAKAPVTRLKVTCPSTVKYKNGDNVTPEVKVKIGNTILDSGDYTLTYYNADGKPVSKLTEKGKYVLQIAPKGNVEATKKKSVITKRITVK